jgi:transposase
MAKTKILAKERRIVLGLDVDAKSVVVAALDTTNGEILFEGRLGHEREDWERFLTHFPECSLWACYEAGYTGFHLCRTLCDLGVDCHVVAPSQVPKSANSKQQKTDRRDALTLAQLVFHPPRTFVRLPTVQEERDRQLIRTREQMVCDKTRTQNRIKALLAFHHVAWPLAESSGHWSKIEQQALRQMTLPDSLRACLNALLDMLDGLNAKIQSFNRQIVALSQTEAYRDRCASLRHLPGVGLLTAMAFLLEVFRPEEFATAEALACHVGLTCCQWSSAQRRRQGHITHWGSPLVRRMLVEAAWSWVRKDPDAARRFQAVSASSKRRKIAIVGMARRLAIVMWAMTVRHQDYAYHWAA